MSGCHLGIRPERLRERFALKSVPGHHATPIQSNDLPTSFSSTNLERELRFGSSALAGAEHRTILIRRNSRVADPRRQGSIDKS
jgi:hypothetical protein